MINKITILLKKITESKFSKDSIWLIGSQGILLVSGLLVNLLIGKNFGSSDLGVFNQSLGFYSIFSSILGLGLNNSIIKKISSLNSDDRLENETLILSSNLMLTFFISTFSTIIIIILSSLFINFYANSEVAESVITICYSLPFYNLNKNLMAYFTSKRMQKEFSILRSLRWILIIIFIFLFYIFQTNIKTTLYSFLITEIILLVYSLIKVNKLLSFKIKKEIHIENIKFGFKSFSAEIFAVFNDKFDLLIIGYFLTNSEVGIYSFFIFFSKALYIFPGILQQNLNPIISKHWMEGTIKDLEIKLKKIIRINFLILIIQTAFTLMFYYILTKYFKQDFMNTTYLLLISMIGLFPSALISWSGSLLVMTGKLKENLIRTILIMVCSLIITFIFTNLYGLIGASIAVALSSIVSFILMFTIIKKVLNIKIIQ